MAEEAKQDFMEEWKKLVPVSLCGKKIGYGELYKMGMHLCISNGESGPI